MADILSSQPTARKLIERSMRLVKKLLVGQSATDDQLDSGLGFLNELLESWNLDGSMIYEQSREVHNLIGGHNPHTIGKQFDGGPAGDIDVPRPVNIQEASIISSEGSEYPIDLTSKERYQQISTKDTGSDISTRFWYEREWPLAKIHLYPVPSSGVRLVLYTWQPLPSGLSLEDKLSLPPGYMRALRFNLAVELAADYGIIVTAIVAKGARDSKAAVARANSNELAFVTPDPTVLPPGGGIYDVRSGNYR